MKIAIVSVNIVKIISVLLFIMAVSSVGAMERNIALYEQNQSISFKSLHGFPLISLRTGQKWYEKLSLLQKNGVQKQISDQDDKHLLRLFNVATKVPLEVQKVIAQGLFDQDKDEHVQKFLSIPITQAYCYVNFLDIIGDKKNAWFAEYFQKSSHFKPDTVCNFSKEIALYSQWLAINQSCYLEESTTFNKKELESMSMLVNTFQSSCSKFTEIPYEFYELTSNVKQKFMNNMSNQLRYLPFLLSVFITLTLPSAFDVVVSEDNIKFNRMAHDFNKEAIRLYKETRNKRFYEAQVEDMPKYDIDVNRFAFIKLVSWFSVGLLLEDCLDDVLTWCRRGLWAARYVFLVRSGFIVGMYSVMSYIQSQCRDQHSLVGISYLAGLYILGCCCYNMVQARTPKRGNVTLRDISALLKRTDIVVK